MAIGSMRHRLILERRIGPAESEDGQHTWVPADMVWAAIRPLSGAETNAAGSIRPQVTHEIRLRRNMRVASDMRFRLGARVFHIVSVTGDDRGYQFCRVEERIA